MSKTHKFDFYFEGDAKSALIYKKGNTSHFWDSTSFRPDIGSYLIKNKNYSANILFDREEFIGGLVYIPRDIYVKGIHFINIR